MYKTEQIQIINNLNYELRLFNQGIRFIAGVDEVGRGPLAGPLVVCAIILPIDKILRMEKYLTNNDVLTDDLEFYGKIRDSKQIHDKKRRELSEKIRNESIAYSIVEIANREIDSRGLTAVTQTAFFGAVQNLTTKPQHVLTDTFEIKKLTRQNQSNIIKGDQLSITISAASIVAKVYRDDLMIKYHDKYPQYGFDRHKGYGTKQHIKALQDHGACPIHRTSFEPVKTFILRNV